MKMLLVLLFAVPLLASAQNFPDGTITVKNAQEISKAMAALGLPVCDPVKQQLGQQSSCGADIKDLYCQTIGALKQQKDGTYVAKDDRYLCTYTRQFAIDASERKPVNVEGPKAKALYLALQNAKLKMRCSSGNPSSEADFVGKCDTKMQDVSCFAVPNQAGTAFTDTCKIIPKWALPVAGAENNNPKVVHGRDHSNVKKSPYNGPNNDGNWVTPAELNSAVRGN